MPLYPANYRASFIYRNAHLATILPSQFRKVAPPNYVRVRLQTPDNDFIDVDWIKKGNKKCVLLLHGFEGDAQRPYVVGMAHHFTSLGFDVAAINYRGCSGEPNNQLKSYHAGKTDDVDLAVQAIVDEGYSKIGIIGFSLGGNLVIKYLAEEESKNRKEIIGGVGVSVPIVLDTSSYRMQENQNWIYNNRFILRLRKKVKVKRHLMTEEMYKGFFTTKNIREIDELYTAPLFGYENAQDYYRKVSGHHLLHALNHPFLAINAKNDSFLTPDCYPYEIAENSDLFYLCTPEQGGHCGFKQKGNVYYHEEVAGEFLEAKCASI